MKIYHNPRCRKSRETLSIIEAAGKQPEIIEYLKEPPSTEELRQIIEMPNISPEDLVRKGESIFKEKYKNKSLSESEWIEALVEHPKLIERPIVVKGEKAIIGRPPENVKSLL
ncbi:MAG: arsenate reductase (glutaredoxin) [Salibacteraceae bacterium]